MKQRRTFVLVLAVIFLILLAAGLTLAQGDRPPERFASTQDTLGTAFTYQGQLKKDNIPVNTICDLSFSLWDAASGGTQIGADQIRNNISVTHGLFTIPDLDFGTFTGEARWLQIAVQCAGETLSTLLTPRQALTAAPYALYASSTGALHGYPVTTTAPMAGQALKWNGSAWSPGVDNDTTYTAGPGLVLTGTQFSIEGSGYGNVLVVAKSGGDFTSIQAALDSIADASSTNRYLIWVAPGTYTETVTMKGYVDIEGAGELLTTIVYSGSETITGTLIGTDNAELRFLTVRNMGGSLSPQFAIGIYNPSASPRLTHVTVSASGGTSNYGIYNSSSSPRLTQVTASASGGISSYGIYNYSSSPTMDDVAISMTGNETYGVYNNNSSSPTMNHSTIQMNSGVQSIAIYNQSSSPSLSFVTIKSHSYHYAYGISNTESSPSMDHVTIRVSHASTGAAYGVSNLSSSPTMRHVAISASGATSLPGPLRNIYGVYNTSSSPKMDDVVIVSNAGSGSDAYGVYNESSSLTMNNVSVSATSGPNDAYGVSNLTSTVVIRNSVIDTLALAPGAVSYGIRNLASSGAYTVTVDNSQIIASTSTISNSVGFTTLVGASKLEGGSVFTGTGTVTCAGVYDENYAFYANTCP